MSDHDLQGYFDSMLAADAGPPPSATPQADGSAPLAPGLAERLAGAISVPVPEEPPQHAEGPASEWVVFRLGLQHYAVDVHAVREIVRPPAMAGMPHGPATLVGMANLRGAVVAVFDAAALVGIGAAARQPAARVIVLEHGDDVIGLLVDSVEEILRFDGARAEPPPRVGAEADYVQALLRQEQRIVLQLDPARLLG